MEKRLTQLPAAFRRFILLTFVLIPLLGWAQELDDNNPIIWESRVEELGNEEFLLIFSAEIAPEWHIFSQFTEEGGSMPSEFFFPDVDKAYSLVGKASESQTVTEFSEVFEVNETFFLDRAEFQQKINRLNPAVNQFKVELYYQICKEVCIPKTEVFTFSLDGSAIVEEGLSDADVSQAESLKLNLKNKERLTEGGEAAQVEKQGVFWIFGMGFVGGLLALLTPCVFPIIPLTVSFFTKQEKGGVFKALMYGAFIVVIYFLLSLPFHFLESVNAQILNTISTNIYLNLFFFVIFVFFAFSFFGFYELTLPSSWANKLDAASHNAGGLLGVFFMALTLAIVSFSCTGPILGGLLGSTTLAEGNVAANLSWGMSGFGLALALPFTMFALFPSALQTLPKSGGWMLTVKAVLGFLELALAFKFLSNADLVGHWGILKREIFIGIWLVIFLAATAYLWGFLALPGQSKPRPLSKGRLITGLVALVFSAYLGYGLFADQPLKLLSGFPPPDFYSLKEKETDCPLGLECYKDFEEGLSVAAQTNKPMLLDFTGWACVNCRKMEENVWSDPEVYRLLKEEYVLVSLYVDDRKALPENEQFTMSYSNGQQVPVRTIGQKWGAFQTYNFQNASQPFYVLMTADLEVLSAPRQYTDKDDYLQWLKQGLEVKPTGFNSRPAFELPE